MYMGNIGIMEKKMETMEELPETSIEPKSS